MERERPSLRAFRPSEYAPDCVPEIEAGLSFEEREAIILLYAARARAGLPLFQEPLRDDLEAGAA